MIKIRNFLYVLAIVFLIGVTLLVFLKNKTQIKISNSPSSWPSLEKCGIENCHGLNITCGSNIPETCTFEYASGDICRQYAHCEITKGQCQLIKDPKFKECQLCVEKCQKDFATDPIKSLECENNCS